MASDFKKVLRKQADKERNENESSFEEPVETNQGDQEQLVSDNDSAMDLDDTGISQKSNVVSQDIN